MRAAQLELFAKIEDSHWWFAARRQIVVSIVRHVLPPSRAVGILDIGCGTGGNVGALARDYNCMAIDASPTAVKLAKSRFPNVRFLSDSRNEVVASAVRTMDFILMMDILEHVADDFLFFSTVFAAMRPRTCMLITVPADMSLWSIHDETVLHYRRYDLARLAALWNNFPVRVRLFCYFNSRLYSLAKLIRLTGRWRRRSFGVAGTDLSMPKPFVNRWLCSIFAGESSVLLRSIDRRNAKVSGRGVSLIALLEREAGQVALRQKPVYVAPDPYNPMLP